MRIPIVLSVSVLLMLMASPGCGQDLTQEFLGLSWGSDIRDQKGYQLLHEKGDLRYYIQPDVVRVIKGFRIARVVYGTHQHRFYSAFLLIDSMEVFDGIKSYMENRYGFPKMSWSVAGEQTTYKWKHETIRMKLKFYQRDRRMKLAFYYTPIANRVNEQESEQNHQRSMQFLPIERDKKPEAMPLLVF